MSYLSIVDDSLHHFVLILLFHEINDHFQGTICVVKLLVYIYEVTCKLDQGVGFKSLFFVFVHKRTNVNSCTMTCKYTYKYWELHWTHKSCHLKQASAFISFFQRILNLMCKKREAIYNWFSKLFGLSHLYSRKFEQCKEDHLSESNPIHWTHVFDWFGLSLIWQRHLSTDLGIANIHILFSQEYKASWELQDKSKSKFYHQSSRPFWNGIKLITRN